MSEAIDHTHPRRRGYTAGCPGCQKRSREAAARWRKNRPESAAKVPAAWRAKRRALLAEIKLTSGCVDCGYNEHPAALDFDHVRGEKTGIIGQMAAGSLDKLMDEIAKCEVRCANCHRVRTAERRRGITQ